MMRAVDQQQAQAATLHSQQHSTGTAQAQHSTGTGYVLNRALHHLTRAGLLKLVFATETLAAGINMPARTTLIAALSRRRDGGIGALHHNELLQMAGGCCCAVLAALGCAVLRCAVLCCAFVALPHVSHAVGLPAC